MAGKKQNIGPTWKTLIKLTMKIWVALKESVKSARILWRTTEVCSNPGFLLWQMKNYRPELQGNLMQKQKILGPMTWKVTQRNVVDTPAWHCSLGNCNRTALRAFSSSVLEKVSSLRLVFLLSSEDPGSWDPVAVEPTACPSTFQDLAEPETFEAEATSVSILYMRAVRELTFCLRALTFCCISAKNEILAERVLTICSTVVILEVTRPTAALMVLT